MSIFSGAVAAIASAMSGTDTKATFLLWFADVDCPKELIK